MDNPTVVFRKFFSDEDESYVAVRSDTYTQADGVMSHANCELSLNDGNQTALLYESFYTPYDEDAPSLDSQFEKAVLRIEALRSACTAALDELGALFIDMREAEETRAELDEAEYDSPPFPDEEEFFDPAGFNFDEDYAPLSE